MSDGLLGTIAQGVNPLQSAGQAVNLMTGMQQLKSQQFALQQAKLQPAYSGLMALRLKDNPTWDDVNASLADSARLGGDISGLTDNVNAAMAKGGTPADFVRSESIRGMPQWEQFQAVTPQRGALETGMGTAYGTFGAPGGASPGQFTMQGFMPRGLTPEQSMTMVTLPDGTRVPAGMIYGPMFGGFQPGMGGGTGGGAGGSAGAGGAVAPGQKEAALTNIAMRESGMRNVPNEQGSGAEGYFQIMPETWKEGAALAGVDLKQYPHPMAAPFDVQHAVASALYDQRGEAPWAASAANAGKYPGAWAVGHGGGATGGGTQYAGPGVPTTGAGPGGITYGPGGWPVMPPVGAEKTWEASTGQYINDRANASVLPLRLTNLQQAIREIDAHPNLQFGPHMEEAQNLWGFLSNVAGYKGSQEDLANQGAFQEVNKELRRYVGSLPGSERSDLAAVDTKLANTSVEQQRSALRDLISRTIGLERMRAIGYLKFQEKYGDAASNNANRYTDELTPYVNNLDPVALGYDSSDPGERKAYYNSLKGDPNDPTSEKGKYENSILEASRLFHLPLGQQ